MTQEVADPDLLAPGSSEEGWMTISRTDVVALDARSLRSGIAVANIPVLLLILFQATGDRRWLEEPYLPTRNEGLGDNASGGLPEAIQEEIRDAAFDVIGAHLAGRALALPAPPPELLVQMLSASMGEAVPDEYGAMISADLLEPSALESHRTLKAPPGFEVLIIGAGLSGIAAAVALKRAGIPFTVVERADEVGGTWLHNRYPGCGVDTPSAIYSFSSEVHRWSRFFAQRDEVESYLVETAEATDIYPHIRFHEEVIAARYDASSQTWSVETSCGDTVSTRSYSLVVSAVGAFSRPKMPDVAGLDSFPGPCVHTAEWPDELDLTGKRVAVIGNGASAMQVVPAIADQVAQLTVFQRSPHWIAPFENFGAEIAPALQTLTQLLPLYRRWYRIRWAWTFNDRLYRSLQRDPDWPHPERSVNAENDGHRRFFTRYLDAELADRPDLRAALTPTYPPFGKRILLDNGWFRTLKRSNVELVAHGLVRVDGNTLVDSTGRRIDVDVVICATGFDVVQFLAPMDLRGRSGRSIREEWHGDDARAYLGTAVPDFPNFFMLYGPNVQPGHGGSLVSLAEIQVHYLLGILQKMFDEGIGEVECRSEIFEEYNRRIDAAHANMIWTHPGMTTYYRNSRGRVVVPGPFRVVDLWHMARNPDLAAYHTRPALSAGHP